MSSELFRQMLTWRSDSDCWLTDTLRWPSWRLAGGAAGRALSAAMAPILAVPDAFAWARVAADDVAAVGELEASGFAVVDCGLTWERGGFDESVPPAGARAAVDADGPAVIAIARRAFQRSRFHLDPRIPAAKADEVKARWVEDGLWGKRGDGVVVAGGGALDGDGGGDGDGDGGGAGADGFLLWLRAPDGAMVIDLVAVDEAARGRGLAADLTRAAWIAAGQPDRIRVGTQASNVTACRVYQAMGFRSVAASFALHYHGCARNV